MFPRFLGGTRKNVVCFEFGVRQAPWTVVCVVVSGVACGMRCGGSGVIIGEGEGAGGGGGRGGRHQSPLVQASHW